MRTPNKTTLVVLPAILLSVAVLAIMTQDERYVAAPGLACVVMVLFLWMRLLDRDQKIPFFDVGMFCSLSTLIYTVYPLVNYWVDGLQFGFLSDNRLHSYGILPAELGLFHLRHVLYLFSFMLFYLMFRDRGSIKTGNVKLPRRSCQHVIIISFLALTVYFFFLQLITGVNYNTSYESEVYSRNFAAFSNLPLILFQISSKLWGILFIFKLALLFLVVSRCRQKKWLIILLSWFTVEVIHTIINKGSRTDLMLFLMAAALLYHRIIKPFSMRFLIASGVSLFIFFIMLGIYRVHSDINSLRLNLSLPVRAIFSTNNEFQILLGTSYDVFQQKVSGAIFPWYIYVNDIITIFPPQQIMPFEKVAASEWYLRELGISETGIGLMWGVISQSIVGYDWLELALRGAILGYILALFHRWYLKHQSGFIGTLLYVFLCIKIYNTFRDTTFSLLGNLMVEFIPFYILLSVGVAILSHGVNVRPENRIALTPQDL